jgi:hypothetical protein
MTSRPTAAFGEPRGGTVFYQIGKGQSRVRVREAMRMMGLDPDAWMWMYNAQSGVLRIF